MDSKSLIILLIVLSIPLLYIIGEVRNWRWLRVLSMVGTIPLLILISGLLSLLTSFDYNASYGFSSKELVDEVIVQLEHDQRDHVIEVLKELSDSYQPTYENKADYDTLTAEAVEALRDSP